MAQTRERLEGKVGIIELYNPPLNFMTSQMIKELEDIIKRWDRYPRIRSIVITGASEGIFITHYSVEELISGFEKLAEGMRPRDILDILRKGQGVKYGQN